MIVDIIFAILFIFILLNAVQIVEIGLICSICLIKNLTKDIKGWYNKYVRI